MHPVYMAQKVTARFKKKPLYRLTYIRQWRDNRDHMTLERLAERMTELGVPTTHATLSRIERGLSPYNQRQLEAIAEALSTDPASLLMRNPTDPEGIWTLWEKAHQGERRMIVDIAKTVLKTGT